MSSPKYSSPCPTSPGKRPRDSAMDHQIQSEGPLRTNDSESVSSEERDFEDDSPRSTTPASLTARSDDGQTVQKPDRTDEKQALLTERQNRLLGFWYEDFAQPAVAPSLPDEPIIAFATAIQARTDVVIDYVQRRRNSLDTADSTANMEREHQKSPRSPTTTPNSTASYTLAGANSHLPPPTLNLIDKYISACRRRRSPNDGRRSVNSGPYRCTFDCGYRTKRAFDWRRHEETHEPQELWLCCVCSQSDMHNPFLVNRKDKFLKHATDKHADARAERILDRSKVAFVPRAELGCRYCEEECGNWDERCRHVLGHYEDEVERDAKRVKIDGADRNGGEKTVEVAEDVENRLGDAID